jgi:hypothetical protein
MLRNIRTQKHKDEQFKRGSMYIFSIVVDDFSLMLMLKCEQAKKRIVAKIMNLNKDFFCFTFL